MLSVSLLNALNISVTSNSSFDVIDVLHNFIALYAVFCSVLLCSAMPRYVLLCAVRMIQVARQEGLNVEQNAAEILVEQVRFINPFTLILPYPVMPCPALHCPTMPHLTLLLLYCTLLYFTLPYLTLPYLTLLYFTLLYLTLPYLRWAATSDRCCTQCRCGGPRVKSWHTGSSRTAWGA